MQDLQGKVALVTGIANKRSIAYAIAQDFARYGCRLVLCYQPLGRESELEKVQRLTEDLAPALLLPLDVTDPASVAALFEGIQARLGRLDVLVHSISGAKREELGGRHSDISLEGYLLAQHISAYSLISLVRAARPLLAAQGGSVLTLTYIGSERAARNYNVMGSAKAALEANVRYLARELGPEGIRVNAISAGPIRTVSASGITDFLDLLHQAAKLSALKRNITLEEVAHTASFLASSLSSGITGQTVHVDGGYNIFG
ncbi:MAG TPA: SDR family oxidoreductase [bacterium]|nr:SDR family oxidoreductase [bacterium]